jgi:hypothetical protein
MYEIEVLDIRKKGLTVVNPREYMVAAPRIELGTQGFSIPCSTNCSLRSHPFQTAEKVELSAF